MKKLDIKNFFHYLFFNSFLYLLSFLGSSHFFYLFQILVMKLFLIIHTRQNHYFIKFQGTWGNHEGSLLLMVISTNAFYFFVFNSDLINQPKKYRIFTLIFQQIIIIGFFLFVLNTSSPFNYLFPVPN